MRAMSRWRDTRLERVPPACRSAGQTTALDARHCRTRTCRWATRPTLRQQARDTNGRPLRSRSWRLARGRSFRWDDPVDGGSATLEHDFETITDHLIEGGDPLRRGIEVIANHAVSLDIAHDHI